MEADDLQTHTAPADAAGERLIADRLDALEAEKVIQRALELEAASLNTPHVITTSQLERIAAEIGVDPAFVHQALGEMRLQPAERSRFERWVLPEDLLETATLSGLSREEAEAAIDKWMQNHEGLIKGGILPDGVEWNIDRRWRTRAKASTLSGGNRMSRVLGSDVAHRLHSVSEHEHVAAFESKGFAPLLLARVLMAAGAFWSAVLLIGAAVNGEFFAGLGLAAVILAASTGLGLAGARWWARGIRGAMRRSLVGLLNSAKAKRPNWFQRRRKPKDS